jgi:hypothetical protein
MMKITVQVPVEVEASDRDALIEAMRALRNELPRGHFTGRYRYEFRPDRFDNGACTACFGMGAEVDGVAYCNCDEEVKP